MSVDKIRGIVIKERQQGESGKQLTVLAKGAGKLYLFARGAKNAKSRLLAGTQLFSYCDFAVLAKNGFVSVNQAELLDSFYGLRNDVAVLSEAVYLLEFTDRICPPQMEQDNILLLLLRTLKQMERGNLPPKLAGRIFEMKSLFFSGVLSEPLCEICGQTSEVLYFHWETGQFFCGKHKPKEAEPLLPAVCKTLAYVPLQEGKKVFSFRLSDEALSQLNRILERYIQVHLGIHLQSRKFAANICL